MVDAPIISLAGLTVTYPDAARPALHDVDLDVQAGETVGLMGLTGAGKTTLGLCLDGIVPQLLPASVTGRVIVDGRDATTVPVREMARSIGLVFDNPEYQLSRPTVADEVAFGLESLGVAPEAMHERIARALAAVGLDDLEDRSPLELSGGQQQRLAIAAVLVMEPRILFMDEPTSNLDPAGATGVFEVARRLVRETGMTLLVADHRVEALAAFVDRIVVLDAGRIAMQGTTADVLARVEELDRLGLRAPQVTEFAHALAPGGARPAGDHRRHPRVARRTTVTGSGPIVAVDGVRFAYETGVVALDGVSFEIGRGSVVGLIGANGSGKTTLGKHLNGLLRPWSGRVVVDGVDTSRQSIQTLARTVGYVFQNPGHQLFARTVADELAYGPRNLGIPPDEVDARVRAVAAALRLADVLGTSPHRLPFPLRKLVGIASVLTMRPRVLVLDEPTTGQDERTVRSIAELIGQQRTAGTTVVCASHDLSLVAAVADRVVVLRDGAMVADGPPRSVIADPEAMAAAGLTPPQITELSLAMPGRAGRPGALSVHELVDEVRASS